MPGNGYDVLVIGGGPAGSTAATSLARSGRRVLLLEKEQFPRFHIGESLLPYNRRIFADLGLLPKLEAARLIRKQGAQFHSGTGLRSAQFVFRNGHFTREHEAFQVERAPFDHLLLEHARSQGVEAREGWSVTRSTLTHGRRQVQARDPNDQLHAFDVDFVIDATGRANLTGNQSGQRVLHPRLRKIAVFGHFQGVTRDSGPTAGDTIIVRRSDRWFWLIPISPEKTSVGCILDQAAYSADGRSPAEIFESSWRGSRAMINRMQDAKLLGAIQTTNDFSYRNRRFVDERLVRVGDATGFLDPIFSSGVYLAMHTGQLAAQTILPALEARHNGRSQLAAYERSVHATLRPYWRMVESYYTQPFMDLLFAPREKFKLASAVNAILAGEIAGGWPLRWRLELFFAMVRIQGKRPFLPAARLG
jgi:FADH2-dependent halogenase